MEPNRNPYMEYVILCLVRDYTGELGLPGDLAPMLRPYIPDITDKEIRNALRRLAPKFLTVHKCGDGRQPLAIPQTDIQNDVEVFRRPDTYLRSTEYTDPRIEELAALFPAPEPEQPRKQYGF